MQRTKEVAGAGLAQIRKSRMFDPRITHAVLAFTLRGFGVTLGLALLFGCSNDRLTSPRPLGSSAPGSVNGDITVTPIQPGDSAAVDSLTRGLALALSDATLRRQVHDDLRDSPFSNHRLHLVSYLSGPRGQLLSAAIVQSSGLARNRLVAVAATRGGLQLSIPKAVDRMFWESKDPVLVEGSALTLSERLNVERATSAIGSATSALAFTQSGVQQQTSVLSGRDAPFIYISPASVGFGPNPEQVRAATPHANRATVSSVDEEIRQYRARGDSLVRAAGNDSAPGLVANRILVCPPDDPTNPCNGGNPPPPPPPRQMGVSIPSGLDYYGCYRPGYWGYPADLDADGVLDSCEAELAIAFKPQVVLMANDCELRRAPAFAVRQKISPDWGPVILVFYAISYMYDCGPYGHRGDSEWIIEEVGPSNLAGHPWALKYATLSAHWDDGFWDNTAGYAARDLEDAQDSPGFGAPRVWVSRNKHANYRTQAVCGGQLLGFQDDCVWPFGCFFGLTCTNPTYFTLDFPASRNLGSHVGPFMGTTNSPAYDPITFSGRYEYYWVPGGVGGDFCGWVAPNGIGCAGAYQKSLTAYGY